MDSNICMKRCNHLLFIETSKHLIFFSTKIWIQKLVTLVWHFYSLYKMTIHLQALTLLEPSKFLESWYSVFPWSSLFNSCQYKACYQLTKYYTLLCHASLWNLRSKDKRTMFTYFYVWKIFTKLLLLSCRGYLSPEYTSLGQVSDKVDVFSFGILVLEIISGRKNIDLMLPGNQRYILEWVSHFQNAFKHSKVIKKKILNCFVITISY